MSLSTLEKWYSRQCNGDWEHGFGVEISTIDNPGWSVGIDLHDTHKQEATFKQKFQIRCGPLNLGEAIEIFARWFDSL